MRSRALRAVVVGAGIGGLAAAIDLLAAGWEVCILDRMSAPGGKMRVVTPPGGRGVDAGPTVLTMAGVFSDLFAASGASLAEHVTLRPAGILARHAWPDGSRLDLHADLAASADAIGRFAGAREARGFLAFAARAGRVFHTLDASFMRAERPSLHGLVASCGARDLFGISPFTTLWRALGQHFTDPRLLAMFGRYATYCGSSPFAAPATLMLVAHAERAGVWLVEGGMHRLAAALADRAAAMGATLRYDAPVAAITTTRGRADGVALAGGERMAADAVVCNADSNALARGLFGPAVAGCVAPTPVRHRSLSALTWALDTPAGGFPLHRHTVFFSDNYPAEFAALAAGRLPEVPTTYVCAQDRGDDAGDVAGPERLLCLVNAPPEGDAGFPAKEDIAQCEARTFGHLRRCGLRLDPAGAVATGPAEFARMFPGTGGALYGPATHGWAASFKRPGTRTRVPGLVLAGGSVHPGPGVPMAALSGRLAASALIADHASTVRSRSTATYGGTWMR